MRKSVFTVTEVFLLSIIWTSCTFVWQSVIRDGLGMAVVKSLGTSKYVTNVIVALLLALIVFGLIALFKNIDVGNTSLFTLVDIPPKKKADEEVSV